MKALIISRKNIKEQIRDITTLGLSLVIGPFFVLLYWLMIPSGSTTYGVMIQNLDLGIQGDREVSMLEDLTYPSGDPMLDVSLVESQSQAENLLRDRDAEVFLIIPEDFSDIIALVSRGERSEPAEITLVGDLTNPYYAVGAVMAGSVIERVCPVPDWRASFHSIF